MVILEDFSDRLNSVYTSFILLLLAAITMANVYFVRPISCSIPTVPKGDFTGYAESVCWSQGTTSLDGGNEDDESQRRVDVCEFLRLTALFSDQGLMLILFIYSILSVGPILSLGSGDSFSFAPLDLASSFE